MQMNSFVSKLCVTVQCLFDREDAQDLTEYALVVSLIAMVCITGIGSFATALSALFSNIDKALF
jgi:Flp pilus assembly pilin Flp